MRYEYEWNGRDKADRRKIFDRIVGQLAIEARADRERCGGKQQRITIRQTFGDDISADDSGSAGAVVDDERLMEPFAQLLRQHAGNRIRAARWKQHNHTYRSH